MITPQFKCPTCGQPRTFVCKDCHLKDVTPETNGRGNPLSPSVGEGGTHERIRDMKSMNRKLPKWMIAVMTLSLFVVFTYPFSGKFDALHLYMYSIASAAGWTLFTAWALYTCERLFALDPNS